MNQSALMHFEKIICVALFLTDGAIHGILPSRRGSSSAAFDMNAEGESERERRERVRSLSAAALAVVEQAIGNPELFEGT